MKFYQPFLDHLQDGPLAAWAEQLAAQISHGISPERFGNITKWQAAIDKLPIIKPSSIELGTSAIRIGKADDISDDQRADLETQLKELHPWRKGPFELFGLDIDTEWHSDWKWDRLKDHISPLTDKHVLDVGCGNGYHCWRMAGDGAASVVGIDPTPLFNMQFQVMQNYIQSDNVMVIPAGIDDLPNKLESFDTVFSMGVLYHRRSPIDHITQLMDCLVSGGELVLETLIIEGDENTVLVPEDRYACMRNVWFIPSIKLLVRWCKRAGLKNIRVVDVNQTSSEEQRATDWMTFHSLKDFLDSDDINKTIEGYPAPRRAILIAEKG
ncbi:MAG: tRNA 5-methoxyuridine(34)/uridine 5-oxyacetic acid(34) synthase CmoB [Sulfuriflexus sp.]|nr:tRNA 5-methoxyuridine(34)/uridine 5-oxyacetic acid(34) synthase CmoB [Sulfuriflexus sp.]